MSEVSLSDFTARPHTTPVEFGDVTVAQVVSQYKPYKNAITLVRPEDPAIEFYLLNDAVATLSAGIDKTLPLTVAQIDLMNIYYDSMQSIGHRVFFYLLLICTRESRHCSTTPALTKACKDLGAYEFWKSIKGSESTAAVSELLNHPPATSFKNYTEHMYQCFMHGDHKSGFAGEAWAKVAKPFRDFVHGVITMEVLLDTVWTLAHNNGPIFNKGMLFNNYTTELQKILDVQRAGQIPNLVEFKESSEVSSRHLMLLEQCRVVLPDFAGEAVNWQKVKELGAKGNWGPKVAKKAPDLVLKIPIDTGSKDWIQVTLTESVKKISRKSTKQ